MKIALDYDETFTEDPIFWDMVIAAARHRLHTVKFVTYRDERFDNDDILTDAAALGIEVVFTGGKQKEHICPDIDVWIDDSPETIVNSKLLGDMYDSCLVQNDMLENYHG